MQSVTWNTAVRKVFYPCAVLTIIWGQWPHLEDGHFLRFRLLTSFSLMIFAFILAVIKLMINCGTADDTLDAILLISMIISVMSKTFFVYIHRDKLRFILNSAFVDYQTLHNDECIALIEKNARLSTLTAKAFSVIAISTLASYLFKVFALDRRSSVKIHNTENITSIIYENLPKAWALPGGCVFDGFDSITYYSIICIQLLQLTILSATNIGVDTLFIILCAHINGQFEILKTQVIKIGGEKDSQANKILLVRIISRHQHLLILAEYIEECFNNIIFVQMLASVFLISTAGFSLLMNLKMKDHMSASKSVLIMHFLLFESYLYTFPSDNLGNQSDDLLRAIYSSEWHTLPAPIMKNIVFMMMRINIPITLTAGKFFYMTRRSYMDVIRTAASYLSVLRLMLRDY